MDRNRIAPVFLPLADQNLGEFERHLLNTHPLAPSLQAYAHRGAGPVGDQAAVWRRKTPQKDVVWDVARIKNQFAYAVPVHLDLHDARVVIALNHRKLDLVSGLLR